MIQININNEIKSEYIKILKEVLFTKNKKRKVRVNTKRFFNFLKEKLEITRYAQMKDLLINEDIHNIKNKYGIISTTEENYKIYDELRKVWAKELVKLTNTKVCPYCNRNFIVNFDQDNTTVELDHFFPKTDYPYLAISLYNLIPSCHTCNHKKDAKLLDIYPYKESFHDYAKFSCNLIKLPFEEKNINLKIIPKDNSEKILDKIEDYTEVLNISTLYDNHKDIVLELMQKSIIYNDSYIDELAHNYSGLFKNREDLLRLITGGYVNDDDINKRPLSKLIKDISEELKLI